LSGPAWRSWAEATAAAARFASASSINRWIRVGSAMLLLARDGTQSG
jgi:hypothetical protein